MGQCGTGPCAMQFSEGQFASRGQPRYNGSMKKHCLGAIISVLAIVLVAVIGCLAVISPSAATADRQGCVLDINGPVGLVVCGGEVVDQLPLPTVTIKGPTITLPPITVPGPTIKVPGPTETITVEVPGPTITAPTETVTEEVTRDVTETVTETATEESIVTETVTGQPAPEGGTITPEPPEASDRGGFIGVIQAVGVGILSLILLFFIVIFGMYLGWRMGRKGQEKEDIAFMQDLLDKAHIYRRQH